MEKGERRVQNAYYVRLLIPIIMMVIWYYIEFQKNKNLILRFEISKFHSSIANVFTYIIRKLGIKLRGVLQKS